MRGGWFGVPDGDTDLPPRGGGRATKRQPLILRKLPLLTEWQPFILTRGMHPETNRSFPAPPRPTYAVKALLLSLVFILLPVSPPTRPHHPSTHPPARLGPIPPSIS